MGDALDWSKNHPLRTISPAKSPISSFHHFFSASISGEQTGSFNRKKELENERNQVSEDQDEDHHDDR